MKRLRKIVILGPQLSGKGTQADLLAKRYKIPRITSGDLLRAEIRKKTKFGHYLSDLLKKGILLSDRQINQIVKKRLRRQDAQRGFVLDGYPRTLPQAKALSKMTKLDLVIQLEVPDKISIGRLAGRRSCVNGHIYHIKFNSPKKKGICDICGKKLIQREDNKSIRRRLSIYHKQTEPLVKYYGKTGILVKIDGRPPIAVVKKLIKRSIRDFEKI